MLLKTSGLKFLIASTLIAAGCRDNTPSTTSPAIAKSEKFALKDEVVSLTALGGRNIAVRVLTPDGCAACPLMIFSHGANAAYDRYDALLMPLAMAGYRVAIPNHTDSEGHSDRTSYTPTDWLPTRIEDYNVIAAEYETTYRIAAGHSFGAMIAQIVGGAEMALSLKTDPAYFPNAVLAYSPPGPIPNYIGPEGWSKIKVPSLVTTGTKDIVPMMAQQWELHLVSYDAAPPQKSFALVYENMDHYMNGAYGRETKNQSEERELAVQHMIDASIFFLSKQQKDGKISSMEWKTQEQSFVEARAR